MTQNNPPAITPKNIKWVLEDLYGDNITDSNLARHYLEEKVIDIARECLKLHEVNTRLNEQLDVAASSLTYAISSNTRLHEENTRLRSALEKIRDDFDGNGADLMSEVADNALKEQPE